MTRTDAHSPTNMDPAAYEYVACFDLGTPGALMSPWALEVSHKVGAAGNKLRTCTHCGAHLRYVCVLEHTPTGEYIAVGETCLDHRFSLATKAEFDKLRKAAQLDREQQKIKAARTAWALEFPEAAAVLLPVPEHLLGDRNTSTLQDMARKLQHYGTISAKAAAHAVRVAGWITDNQARQANPEPTVDAPEGRQEVTGTLVSVKWQDNDYGGRLVMTVKVDTDAGAWLCWGSVPSALSDATAGVGDLVKFTATLERSSDKPNFAFFKRPSKATLVWSAEQSAARAAEAL
jgi:hypothetical protein